MTALEAISEVIIEDAIGILPAWGWAIVGSIGLIILFALLMMTKKTKIVMFGCTLSMITAFFGVRGLMLLF